MANYVLVDADQIDKDLKSVADHIRAKGATTEELSFPDGFNAAVDAIVIETGIKVQKNTGSFTIRDGKASVNCGFRPDVIRCNRSGAEVSFYLEGVSSSVAGALWDNEYEEYWEMNLRASSTGFSVSDAVFVSIDTGEADTLDGFGFNYTAVKYTQ